MSDPLVIAEFQIAVISQKGGSARENGADLPVDTAPNAVAAPFNI